MSVLAPDEGKVEKALARRAFPWSEWLGVWDPIRSVFDEIRVEQFTEGDELIVRAELPGIDPAKDVEITVEDHRLTLEVERRDETRSERAGHIRSEFRYGTFSRTLTLPHGTDAKDVKATYTDGILMIRMPFKGADEAVKIPVTRA